MFAKCVGILCIISILFVGLFGYNDYREVNRLSFVVDLETSVSGDSQVFYNVGRGYNEEDSYVITVKRGNMQRLTFPILSSKAIQSIRFDPINSPAVVRIKEAWVENKQGDIIKKFPLHNFRPIQQVEKVDTRDGTLVIHTEKNANDPILEIENSMIGKRVSWKNYMAKRGWIILGHGLLILLFLIGLNYLLIIAKRSQYIMSKVRYLQINLRLYQTRVNWNNFLIILSVISIISLFSALIPPLQSPDESAHLTRAYLLSKGKIILEAPAGLNSGGMIDSGLAAFFKAYAVLPFKKDRKLSADEIDSANFMKWTGIKEFVAAPNMASYFPIIYLPQAIGLTLGEKLGLTINNSYLLARFMALLSITLILFAAFKIYPTNPLTIALLILPMSVFQFSSASLDGMAAALSIFSIAAFLRIAKEKENAAPGLFYILTFFVVLVATSRPHLLPLLVLVWGAGFYMKKRKYFYIAGAASIFSLAWLIVATQATVGLESRVGASTSSVALFYMKNPLQFFDVFTATIFNGDLVRFYRNSFLGNLGWLDTQFSPNEYKFLCICTVLIGLLSVSLKKLRTEWIPRFLLLFSAFASILLLFFALLITWNHHPAKAIDGIQGRYLLVPATMLAYAVSGGLKLHAGIFRKIAILLVILLLAFMVFCTPKLLIERYYMAPEQLGQIPVMMHVSALLENNNPIKIYMSDGHVRNLQPLKRIGIQFGTYMRKNAGRAELRLTASDGHVLAIPFELSDLADNQ